MIRLLQFAILATFLVSAPVEAAKITSVKVTESASMPAVRPDWPIPREGNQIFYLQRSLNSNMVIYTARFDGNGNLDAKNPAQVYWRRYNTNGARKALKSYERRFAFGLNVKRTSKPGVFNVRMKAVPQLPMVLRQTGRGKAELVTKLGGRSVRATYVYVNVDESGLIPNVTSFTIFGQDLATGRAIGEEFRVKGGEINQ